MQEPSEFRSIYGVEATKLLDDLVPGPTSQWFGADVDGRVLNPGSFYAAKSRAWAAAPYLDIADAFTADRPLSFDVSNNRVAAAFDVTGVLRAMVSCEGIVPAYDAFRPGVYVHKATVASDRAMAFRLRRGPGNPWRALPVTGMRLLRGLVPRTSFADGPLHGHVVAFAPIGDGGAARPQAIVMVLLLHNRGADRLEVEVGLPGVGDGVDRDADRPEVEWGRQEFVAVLGSPAGAAPDRALPVSLAPGERRSVAVAAGLGESRDQMCATLAELARKPAAGWLQETLTHLARPLGQLTIEPSNYHGEALTRQVELCRQSVLLMADGQFGGAFYGSDPNGEPGTWMRDTYYQALPLAWFHGSLCRAAIRFLTEWGVPPAAWGRGRERFPAAAAVTHSLGNAVAAIALAGAYYRMTGDRQFFHDNPDVYRRGAEVLDQVLTTSQADAFLFPSIYISDGLARGDYHTGSNVLAWYAFRTMARLGREVFADGAADRWAEAAASLRQAVYERCVALGPLGPQFTEGAYRDGSFVPGHDGEESDLTLAPFYGFCRADDPALTNHARLAFTRHNPYYLTELDGVSWCSLRCYGPTFPAFVHALAGAIDETAVASALERIRRRTDHDGSFWWWPHLPDWRDQACVKRGPGKSGWGAGVHVLRFINDVIGLTVDVPARRVRFRPFCPWALEWRSVELGSVRLDIEFRPDDGRTAARIVNHGDRPFEVGVELTAPGGRSPARCLLDGREGWEAVRQGWRYGRASVMASVQLAPQAALDLAVDWR
jgi:hypothetical protein